VDGALTLGNTEIASADFTTNEVNVELKPDQFSVTGAVGGSFTVGGLTIGRPIPINFQIPNGASMLSTTNSKQTQNVRTSLVAAPQKTVSDNKSGSGGRHSLDAVNTAVSNVKTAVNKALNSKPRHAKPDSDD
jgi:hypothetical protein